MNRIKALFFTATLAMAMLTAAGAAAAKHDDSKPWKVAVEAVTAPLYDGSSGSGDSGDSGSGDSGSSGSGDSGSDSSGSSGSGESGSGDGGSNDSDSSGSADSSGSSGSSDSSGPGDGTDVLEASDTLTWSEDAWDTETLVLDGAIDSSGSYTDDGVSWE